MTTGVGVRKIGRGVVTTVAGRCVGVGSPLAAVQLGYKMIDVGPDSGVFVGASLASYFSSSLTNNVSPALTIGFH